MKKNTSFLFSFCLLIGVQVSSQASDYTSVAQRNNQNSTTTIVEDAILLPIEILGAEGIIEERKVTLNAEQFVRVDKLWLQANNIGYENKASIKINNQGWVTLNHDTVNIQSPEKERGGMAHGGQNTIRFSLPATGFMIGENTIQFRFNISDAISNGYRIVKLNLLDIQEENILGENAFVNDDPMLWEAPYTDAASIAEGKDYWYNKPLRSNYLEIGKKGFWYGYQLNGQAPINAKCASCHTQDGRDLEIFSYSNKSIIERSKFHMLTEEEGKKIASYIRSLSSEHDNVGRYGRPWNPPYQPGPEIANIPIEEWAAGAGLDAVLEADKDMLPYMFPNGVDQEKVYDRFDSDKMVDRTTLPIAIQFPDWKHWLPMIHPMDAYTKDNYWNNPLPFSGNQNSIHPKEGYKFFRKYLEAMPPSERDPRDLMQKNRDFWYHYRFFLAQRNDGNSTLGGHWREPYGWATSKLGNGVPREFAATSLARLMAVQFFEVMNEFNLQDKAHWFVKPIDQPADRQWFGENYQVFEVPPHFQASVSEKELPINDGYDIAGNGNNFHGQSPQAGAYESTIWYHLQLIVNGGNGMVKHNSPMDYNYHPTFILKASSTSGIYEPLRYYHSLNAMYQFRSWTGGPNPNDGRGFRIRVQGPWHIIGRSDSHQLEGFAESVWPTFLDRVKPGMSKWVLNAQLRQFLTEVQRPGNNLENWNRQPNGGSNELDAISKKTSDLKDMSSYVGLDYWADKFYYLFPEFAKLGVDCKILEEMIDWCAEAWPNIDWSPFRSQGELQLNLLTDQEEDCSASANRILAQTTNEGTDPIYEWWIGGEKILLNTNELDTRELRPGSRIKCRVTSSTNCISNGWVEREVFLPDAEFEVKMRKNNGTWEILENKVACIDDTIEFKIDLELQDPLFWLDAMDVTNNGSEPSNGSAIKRWFNKSKSGFTLHDQSNSKLRPTYNKTGMNGLPAVMFGMNNADGLKLFPTNNDNLLNDNWTMVMAAKFYVTNDGDWNAIVGNENGNSGFAFYIDRRGSGGKTRTKINGKQNHGRVYQDGADFVLTIAKEGKKIKVYINGEFEEEIESSSTRIETSKAFYLGQRDGGNSNAGWYHRGPISEVLFYDRLIAESHIKYLEGYLMHKWRFESDLAQSHIYKKSSPLYVNLQTPNGEILVFDNHVSSNKISLNKNEKFGEYIFTSGRFNCAVSNAKLTVANADILHHDVVKYSINQGRFKVGNNITITEFESLELVPNYEINGDYQWEQPNGNLLAINANPEKFIVTDSDNLTVWKLHLKQDIASCIATDKVYKTTINITSLPENKKDDDLDGVMNDVDQCPNSVNGGTVNSIGCFDLPVNNYIIETFGETCLDADNGSISISAGATHNYILTVNDADTYNFTNDFALNNLSPGDYLVCITVDLEEGYKQCFNLTVVAAESISGISVQSKNGNVVTENMEITSGTAPYTISINGKKMLTTPSRKFAIDVHHGDKINVSSKFICEGGLDTDVDLAEYFSVYPNPTTDVVHVVIPNVDIEEVTAVVYNLLQQKISEKSHKLIDGKMRISLGEVPPGVYFIKLKLNTPINLKIVKQ